MKKIDILQLNLKKVLTALYKFKIKKLYSLKIVLIIQKKKKLIKTVKNYQINN